MFINVLDLLEESAKKVPNQIALCDASHSISYEMLVTQAKKTGYLISQVLLKKPAHNQPIVVSIDRNIESIILFLGVLYSGNFYVPLDRNMPDERITLIISTLSPVLILSSVEDTLTGHECFSVSSLSQLADSTDFSKMEEVLTAIRTQMIDTDPVYSIFTSGSTGIPKGVLVSHRSVIDLVEQFSETFSFPEKVIIGNQAPFDFDVSVKDIYNTLFLQGTCVVIPKQLFSQPLKLIEYLNEHQINTLIWAVSAMRIVENFKTFSKITPHTLKLIMFSGEIMPARILSYWQEALPGACFVNLYGPTEITCNCSYYIVDRKFCADEAIPIGTAFRNTSIFLLDRQTSTLITCAGHQGEICVRGTCLALGYYHSPDKTAEAFTQNPLVSDYPQGIYKTGDIGYYGEDGLLYFAARKDNQIKHMGHRIELGEIELHINAIPYIDAAVCIFDTVHEKIVLCYQKNSIHTASFSSSRELERDMIQILGKKLPKFMWPNRFKEYDCLPLNKNGKIDRVLLKQVFEEHESQV